MHKKITIFGIASAIIILAVCIGAATAEGTAVAGMANVDASAPHTAADSNYGTPVPAYSNYDAIWSSSGNQLIMESWLGQLVGTPTHWSNSFQFGLASSGSTVMVTPFVNTISKTGIHPKVRYLYFTLKMPTGVSVTSVAVSSGATLVYSSPVTWAGTGAVKDYTLDMGSYHDMVRGINTAIAISNSQPSMQSVYSYGAGAKQEW